MSQKKLDSILIKPAGPDCNMLCTYCFYLEKTELFGSKKTHRMTETILKELVRQAMHQADREIKARLALADITAPASDDTLKAASLNLSIAGVFTRLRADGSKPSSLKVGDISMGDNIDAAISELKNRAWESVTAYIRSNGVQSRDKWYLRKVNR